METLDIIVMVSIFLLTIAGLLLYSIRKTPVKKLNIKQTLPSGTEFSQELVPQPDPGKEFVPEPPSSYGENNCTVLVKDPYWVYVYWEVSGYHKDLLQQQYGSWEGTTPFLRVYRFDGGQLDKIFDVPLDDFATNWYLRVPENTTLVVDIMRNYPDGKSITILRSSPVTTPRAYMSDVIDEEWMLVDENQKKLYKRIGIGNGPSSPDFYNPQRN